MTGVKYLTAAADIRVHLCGMADNGLKAKALERALSQLGPDVLSARLNAPPELIQTWINGHATMPHRKFLLLVDVLDELGDASAPKAD